MKLKTLLRTLQHKPKYTYLICGKSGSGKDSIVSEMCLEFGYTALKSYTTRPRRLNEENTHTFIDDKQYDKLNNIVAETIFNGYRYCATQEQLDKADFYIIDKEGIEFLKENYKGQKSFKVIYIDCSVANRSKNMKKRGDTDEDIKQRIIHDEQAFVGIKEHIDYVIYNNSDIDAAIYKLYKYVRSCEKIER